MNFSTKLAAAAFLEATILLSVFFVAVSSTPKSYAPSFDVRDAYTNTPISNATIDIFVTNNQSPWETVVTTNANGFASTNDGFNHWLMNQTAIAIVNATGFIPNYVLIPKNDGTVHVYLESIKCLIEQQRNGTYNYNCNAFNHVVLNMRNPA